MKFYINIIFAFLVLMGCKNDNSTHTDYAFLGGEIINANNDYVVIYESDKVLDSVKLDRNNRFVYKFKSLNPGFYTFRHGGEIQMVLLEPKDSIMFRINTLEFDESLVYTGKGAKKNNYFINEFLQNEIDEKKIFELCQSDAKNYADKVDSLKDLKQKKLSKFQSKCETSELFNKIAQANIDYNYYFNKEVYPFVHYGKNKSKIIADLPDDFYSHRDNIDYNDDFLKDYFVYNTFLKYHVSNLALHEHFKNSNDSIFNRMNLDYNLKRFDIIDSLVTNPKLKENLLYHFAINYLANSKDAKGTNTVLKAYTAKSDNKKGINRISKHIEAINNLKVGNDIPSVELIDYNHAKRNLNEVIDAPTVICFWSHTYYKHFKESHYKVKELQEKYPEVNFVMLNIDDYGVKTAVKTLKRNLFPVEYEFVLSNPEAGIETLAIRPITKAIIVDANQKIVNNNTNIFAVNFEEELLGLLNQ